MWGRPTTRKLAATVVAKSDEVMRERGCRCGGIVRPSSRFRLVPSRPVLSWRNARLDGQNWGGEVGKKGRVTGEE